MAKKKIHSKTKSAPVRKKPQRSLLGTLIKWGIVAALWCGIVLACLFAWYAQELPDITKSASFDRKRAIIVKAADGSEAARYGEIVGNSVTVKDLPACLPQAVLSIEDRRFYYHFGLDPIGVFRAITTNIVKGRLAQGGSTITQQLAKNLFLSQERTLKRKIQEAMLAIWLEATLTKDEILSAYLNRVYLGTGTYGVDAASRLYFNKPVGEMNIRECATIAGMLKAPSRYSPMRNPTLSQERANIVIGAMVDAGYLTKDEAKNEKASAPKPVEKPAGELAVRYYTDWVVDQLDEIIGTPDQDLIVETTLDKKVQASIEVAINKVITEAGESKKISEGAMIVMRPNGQVVALVGGKNYNESQFNRATQGKRPAGSAFKPIVYLSALERGWGPQDILIDEPIVEGRYRPKNYGGKYLGEVTLEQALTYSLNTIAFQLAKTLGPDAIIDAARRLGITSDLEPNLSIALGANGVALLEMATAYSIIANGGYAVEPFAITKITTKDGELIYQRSDAQSMPRVFRSADIQNITSMMNSVMEYGTGQGARFGVPAAGKTGTSDDSRDAMFMGFTRELVGTVWLGNDDNSPMRNVTGGSYPATIWREVMSQANGRYGAINQRDFGPAGTFESMLEGIFFTYGRSPESEQQQPQADLQNENNPADHQPRIERPAASIPESYRYND